MANESRLDFMEIAERRKKLFEGEEFESALFCSGESRENLNPNFFYFSSCAFDGAYLLLKKNSGLILTHRMNYQYAKNHSHYPVKIISKRWLKKLGKDLGKKLGISAKEINFKMANIIRKETGLKLIDLDEKAYKIRSQKSAEEISFIKKAVGITKKILNELDPWESKTESELADKLKISALQKGAEIAFQPIVASGKNTVYPHHIPSNKKLGDLVLIDFGIRYKGYCSDITRCYFRRRNTDEEKTYLKCQEVFWKIFEMLDECEKSKDIAILAEKAMKEKRLPPLIHSIGHGVGLEIHEYPRIGKKSEDRLADGTVIALEPAAYLRNYGVRFENTVVNQNGWRIL
ncbi:MAG: M24 family metallopeptidase [Candidatus Anstonellaceae archaeon]